MQQLFNVLKEDIAPCTRLVHCDFHPFHDRINAGHMTQQSEHPCVLYKNIVCTISICGTPRKDNFSQQSNKDSADLHECTARSLPLTR